MRADGRPRDGASLREKKRVEKEHQNMAPYREYISED